MDLASLASEAWITDHVGSAYHPAVPDRVPVRRIRAGTSPTTRASGTRQLLSVAAGLGVALIPRLAELPESYPVHRVRLHGDSAPSRSVIVAIRAGCSRHPLIVEALDGLRVLASEASLAIA